MRKRLHERASTLKPALVTGNGLSVACCVRDLSPGGAKLRVADPGMIPDEFQLLLKDTRQARRAKVRWRRKAEVGVAFLDDRRVFGRRNSAPSSGPK